MTFNPALNAVKLFSTLQAFCVSKLERLSLAILFRLI